MKFLVQMHLNLILSSLLFFVSAQHQGVQALPPTQQHAKKGTGNVLPNSQGRDQSPPVLPERELYETPPQLQGSSHEENQLLPFGDQRFPLRTPAPPSGAEHSKASEPVMVGFPSLPRIRNPQNLADRETMGYSLPTISFPSLLSPGLHAGSLQPRRRTFQDNQEFNEMDNEFGDVNRMNMYETPAQGPLYPLQFRRNDPNTPHRDLANNQPLACNRRRRRFTNSNAESDETQRQNDPVAVNLLERFNDAADGDGDSSAHSS